MNKNDLKSKILYKNFIEIKKDIENLIFNYEYLLLYFNSNIKIKENEYKTIKNFLNIMNEKYNLKLNFSNDILKIMNY